MKSELRFQLAVAVVAVAASMFAGYAVSQTAPLSLASPESFASISDTDARSAAMFTELGKVLTHPRCYQLPSRERQAAAGRREPAAPTAGDARRGRPWPSGDALLDLPQAANFEPGRMPGHPEWHLAPREMAWEGKTVAEICAQIKDPAATAAASSRNSSIISVKIRWWLGLGSRRWPQPRARHAKAGRCAGRGLGENRRACPAQ
jgi:hypothetical protein